MKNFAVINNNTVVNVVFCDTKETAEAATGFTCIESTTENPAMIGYLWDGEQFTPPVVDEPTE